MRIFHSRKSAVTAAILLLLLLVGIPGIIKARYSNDISRLFPDNSESAKTFRVINQAHLADTFQLEFIAPDGKIGQYREYLQQCAAKLRADRRIKHLHFELPAAQLNELFPAMPELVVRQLPAERLNDCDPAQTVHSTMTQLATPAPGTAKRLRNSPLGLETQILAGLERLNRASGLVSSPEAGFLADSTGSRALMIFEADIPLGETAAAEALLKDIRHTVGDLPDGLSYRVHSGTLHSIGNEKVLKHDSTLAGILSVVFFVIILVFFGRSWRDAKALWILLIPLASSLLAFGLVSWIFPQVFLFVIGLGSCVAGLVVDQGIHVYIACRSDEPHRKLRALVRPMVISTASSCAVFILLAFTDIAAYVQLAVFASLSLTFSTLISLLILPEVLQLRPVGQHIKLPEYTATGHRITAIVLPVLIVAGGVWGISKLNIDLSMTALDGTPKEILAQEADFRRVWMKDRPSPAILAAVGDDEQSALQKLEACAAKLADAGIEPVLPPISSTAQTEQIMATYRTEEAQQKIAGLQQQTAAECRNNGLPEEFYAPVFESFAAPGSKEFRYPAILQSIQSRMVKQRDGKTVAMALLPDDPAQTGTICRIIADDPDTALLSGNSFKYLVQKDLGGRFAKLLPWALALALLLGLSVRGKMAVLTVVPVVLAILSLSAVFAIFQIPVTPAVLFALILLTGLAVDYGVYAVHQLRSGDTSLRQAMLLSALTTALGAGSLIFSAHPALSGTGLVLAIGIAVAGLTGIYILPVLAKIKCRGKTLLFLLTAGFLCGCQSMEPELPVKKSPLMPQAERYTMRSQGTLGDGNDSIPVIMAAKIDRAKREIAVVLLNNAGMKLCTLSNVDGAEFELICPPVCRSAARFLADDLAEIAFSGRIPANAVNFIAAPDGSSWSYSARHWWYGTRKINLENIVYKVEKQP